MNQPIHASNAALALAVRKHNLAETNMALAAVSFCKTGSRMQGASPDHVNRDGTPVLHLAAVRKSADGVKYYHMRAWVGHTPHLLTGSAARCYARRHCLRLLLEYGANVHRLDPRSGNSPLHTAAMHGNIAGIFICVEFGADILSRNREGLTPREAADRHFGWVRRMVSGADPAACLRRFERAFELQLCDVMQSRRRVRLYARHRPDGSAPASPLPVPRWSPSAESLDTTPRAAQTAVDRLEDMLDCVVCAGRMIDPATLPCGHSLCRCCCQALVDFAAGKELRCPLDRTAHAPVIPPPTIVLRAVVDAVSLANLPSLWGRSG